MTDEQNQCIAELEKQVENMSTVPEEPPFTVDGKKLSDFPEEQQRQYWKIMEWWDGYRVASGRELRAKITKNSIIENMFNDFIVFQKEKGITEPKQLTDEFIIHHKARYPQEKDKFHRLFRVYIEELDELAKEDANAFNYEARRRNLPFTYTT